MPRRTYDFTIDCPIPPHTIFAALTDFSEKRPRYFPNLSRSRYQLLDSGEQTARVVEGAGPFMSQERYHWSNENRVWAVVEKSNVAAAGGITDIKIHERVDGGSHVTFHIEREFTGGPGAFMLFTITANGGKRYWRRTYMRVMKAILREMHRSDN